MGLRHLPVVNNVGEVRETITCHAEKNTVLVSMVKGKILTRKKLAWKLYKVDELYFTWKTPKKC